ncbi:VENN motif pre-toxin domain-containing protein [Paraburkholderia phenoliruptrix]
MKAIDPTGADLSPGQQAAMAGFATLLGGGLAGLAGANVQGGALAAQNEVLNNTDNHPQDAAKNGGFLNAVGNWLQNTYGDPVGSIENWTD